MNVEGHRDKAERLQRTLRKLSDDADFETIIEVCYAAAVHRIALVCERRLRRHHDTHKGLPKFLDDAGLSDLAATFRQLELLRTAKYYGSQGNGRSAKEAKQVLDAIEGSFH